MKFPEVVRSRRLAVGLLITAAILEAAGTILAPWIKTGASHPPWLLASARFIGFIDTDRSPVFLSVMVGIVLNMVACTWHRTAFLRSGAGDSVARSRRFRLILDIALHISLLVMVAGGAGKALWGTVRTQNIHVGGATDSFYDFASGRDEPLGFTLEVLERVNTWHPVRALIGINESAAGTKVALVEAGEGRTVEVPGTDLTLQLELAGPAGNLLRLVAAGGGRSDTVELETVERGKASADAGPFRLTLVAWRRDLKAVRSRIACSGGRLPRQVGWISPQERLACRGVGFALTAWGEDPDGSPYVGIQAVRDPAAPLFWGGSVAFIVSAALFLALKERGSGEKDQRFSPARRS